MLVHKPLGQIPGVGRPEGLVSLNPGQTEPFPSLQSFSPIMSFRPIKWVTIFHLRTFSKSVPVHVPTSDRMGIQVIWKSHLQARKIFMLLWSQGKLCTPIPITSSQSLEPVPQIVTIWTVPRESTTPWRMPTLFWVFCVCKLILTATLRDRGIPIL